MAIRAVLEEFQGRTPDPARSTVQLVCEVIAHADESRRKSIAAVREVRPPQRVLLTDKPGGATIGYRDRLDAARVMAFTWQPVAVKEG